MDEIAEYNKERWNELAQNRIGFSVPFLDLDKEKALESVDPEGIFGDITGKDVLCLASGGGQQSVAFALLGANVTVFDLSEVQLERDREAAEHYNLNIQIVNGDMRDLSCFSDSTFDIVWQPPSLNFIPEAEKVFWEVARVLRESGYYRIQFANPFFQGSLDQDWDGEAYRICHPYRDGGQVPYKDSGWEVGEKNGKKIKVTGPKEFRHGFGRVVNTLIDLGFIITRVSEGKEGNLNAKPGSWDHFLAYTAAQLTFWMRYFPVIMEQVKK